MPLFPLLLPTHSTRCICPAPPVPWSRAKSVSPEPMCSQKDRWAYHFTMEGPGRGGVWIPSFNMPRATQQAQSVAWASKTEAHPYRVCPGLLVGETFLNPQSDFLASSSGGSILWSLAPESSSSS